jgi:chaperonin cofactor prefoldin
MEMQTLLNILFGLCNIGMLILGWIFRQVWDAVKDLKEDVKEIEVNLPTNYVQKKDLDARLDRIESLLDKLYEKLDTKADK